MTTVLIGQRAGEFAENKDLARELRTKELEPALARGDTVQLDFTGVTGATQSFVHALISEPMRIYGSEVLDRVEFKNCNESIRGIVTIVTEYMQES